MEKQPTNSPKVARRWPRFTIRGLLWTMTIVAALFPAAWFAWFLLLNASTHWGTHAFLGTAVLLALAGAAAMNCSGLRRAFWSGFATVGLAYFVLVVCNITASSGHYSLFRSDSLVTTQCNRWVYRDLAVPALLARRARGLITFWTDEEDFVHVAHLLWSLLFAAGGGLVSLVLWAAFRPRTAEGGDDERS